MFRWTCTWLCLLKSLISPSLKNISPVINSVRSYSQSAVTFGTCWWMNSFCFLVTALKLCLCFLAERREGATVLVCVMDIVVSFCLLHLLFIRDLIQLYTPTLSTSFSVGLRVTAHIESSAVNYMCNEFNQNRDLWDAASFLGCTFIFIPTSHPFDFITAVSFTLSSHETPSCIKGKWSQPTPRRKAYHRFCVFTHSENIIVMF